MQILIIEDEDNAASRLKNLISKIKPKAEILGVIDSIADAVKWFHANHQPDLVFLDIQLSDGLSFSIFENTTINCPIIFTTAFDEYAIKAFEVNSIDYLLKPIYEDKLIKSFEKYDQMLKNWSQEGFQKQFSTFMETMEITNKQYKTRFLINKADSYKVITVDEIAYFIADNKEVLLVTKDNQKHFMNEPLDKLEKQLDPSNFFRVNRKFIVSINAIAKISNYFNYKIKLALVPVFEEEIIIGRKKVSEFKQWLNG